MNPIGAFSFVFHSHLPYCRKAGMWPFGEEWVYEGLLETYIPLLDVLMDLAEGKIETAEKLSHPIRATVSFTPILCEMLADEYMIRGFERYAEDKIQRASDDQKRFSASGAVALEKLAIFYRGIFTTVLEHFQNRYHRNILQAYRRLQEAGFVEILTSGATHGYLPLFSRDSSIYAQIRVGVDTYKRHFGKAPRGIWLPECAYRGARILHVTKTESYRKPAIDEFLSQLGISYFLCDSHALEGGDVLGGKRMGLYASLPKFPSESMEPAVLRHTRIPFALRSGVCVFGRNKETGLQVWSGDYGYPGDGNYREFHRKDSISGLQYWKITSRKTDLGKKEIYDPSKTAARVNENADHFSRLVENLLKDFSQKERGFGIVASPYDTELFGHWWFEGIPWLKAVLLKTSRNPAIEPTTLGEHLKKRPAQWVIDLPESSWGEGGRHQVWLNPKTQWIWKEIHSCELAMEKAIERHPQASGLQKRILDQAARELLILEASDWPFLITTRQAPDYAKTRFEEHLKKFRGLLIFAEHPDNPEAETTLVKYEDEDNPFSSLDYRVFSRREPPPLT